MKYNLPVLQGVGITPVIKLSIAVQACLLVLGLGISC